MRNLFGSCAAAALGSFVIFGQIAMAAEPVKVGIVVALTGAFAVGGNDIKNGATLAADTINEAGGLKGLGGAPLQLVFADSHSNPASAASEGDRLISQSGVSVIAGTSTSAETIPLTVVSERKGVPMLVINGQSEDVTNRGFKWLWSQGVQDKDFVSTCIEALKIAHSQNPGLKRVAMVYGDNETGQAAARAFRELIKAEKDLDVVGDIEYSARAQDFGPTVLKIKGTGAQMIVVNAAFREALGLTRAFDQYDYHPVVVTLGGGTADPKFGAQAGKSADGFFNSTSFAVDLVKVKDTTAAYQKKFASPMSTNAMQGYQTVRIIAEVLERAKSTQPDTVADAFRSIKIPGDRVLTSSAYVEFEGSLNKGRRALLTQWQGSSLVTVWPPDVATGQAVKPTVNVQP